MEQKRLSGKFIFLLLLLLLVISTGALVYLVITSKISLSISKNNLSTGSNVEDYSKYEQIPEVVEPPKKDTPFSKLSEKKIEWVVDPTLEYIDECVSEYKIDRNKVSNYRTNYDDFLGGYIVNIRYPTSVVLDNDLEIDMSNLEISFNERYRDENNPDSNSINLKNRYSTQEIMSILEIGDFLMPYYNESETKIEKVSLICDAK